MGVGNRVGNQLDVSSKGGDPHAIAGRPGSAVIEHDVFAQSVTVGGVKSHLALISEVYSRSSVFSGYVTNEDIIRIFVSKRNPISGIGPRFVAFKDPLLNAVAEIQAVPSVVMNPIVARGAPQGAGSEVDAESGVVVRLAVFD